MDYTERVQVPVLNPEQHWECPSCGLQHVTREARPHTPMHFCPKHGGLNAPFAAVPPKAEGLRRGEITHRLVERGDDIGADIGVAFAGSKAVMAVHTERSDGHDTHVYAPAATLRIG